ncbi:hypothetical protein KQX54_020567 [Cotesia glomerata]|uniref:Uncharacterized protein n=1 Tax=Cotesia glomerata TaxID=32391 RepID=A0AAV7IG01_COTGL|nr:hypothetical protein KQX54_020567 [Cotesia glomerata]
MSEVNDEVNNDKVDNENSSSQLLEIMPPRSNDKVEGQEQENEENPTVMLTESVEKTSESGALKEITVDEVTPEKVPSVNLIHGNDLDNSVIQYVKGLASEEDEEEKEKSNNPVKGPDLNPNKSKSRHKQFKCCPEGFCELVARRKHRTDKLMERQAEISTRLATLETWLPMVTVNKIMQSDCDPQNVIKYIEEQAAIMSAVTNQSTSRHEAQEIGGLEAERKEALRRHEEARTVLHEKQLQLKKVNEQIEDAKRKQEELQRKIYDAERNNEERNTDQLEDDESLSEYSFGPEDLANITRLEELIVGEHKVKKELKELERREAAYVEILKKSQFWKANKAPGGESNCLDGDRRKVDGEVDKLRGQLAAKSAANQQLADRICQLEDQIESLESKLRNCNKIIEFRGKRLEEEERDGSAKLRDKMKTTNGTGDSEISVRDKATLAKVTTTDRSSGSGSRRKVRSTSDGKVTEEKSVNAVVGTSSKNTYTRIEVTDRAVQDPIPGESLGGSISGEKSSRNEKIQSIQDTRSSYASSENKDGKLQENLKGETGEETVERITTFDEAQTSGKTLLSGTDNESSRVGVDSSWNNDKTLRDNGPGLDDNSPGEMDTGIGKRLSAQSSSNEKLDRETKLLFGNPESLLDDSTASKIAHLNLSTIPQLEDHNTRSINDQSTQYDMELPFGPENAEIENSRGINPDVSGERHSINEQALDQSSQREFRTASGDKSFVSMKSRLSREETNYDISGIPDDTLDQSRDQSKHSSMRFEHEKSKGTAEQSRNQSKHSSVRFEKTHKSDGQSFKSMRSELSKELTNYEFSDVEDDQLPEAISTSKAQSSAKSFVSLKSQLSKEETDYGVDQAASGQEPATIAVKRNELESWLKSLYATHSKCGECNIKKPEVIEIIEAIQRHLEIGSLSEVTKTGDQSYQIQMRSVNYDPNQDSITDGKRSLIKKRGTKPQNLKLRQSIGEEEEMMMIKEHIGLPSGTSTPIDKESKQTAELLENNYGIDPARSIQYSGSYRQASSDVGGEDREAIRSESINSKSIGSKVNTSGGNNVSSGIQVQFSPKADDRDKLSERDFKRTADTITSSTMDKVYGDRRDVGTLVTPPLVDESQSDQPDASLLLNENSQRQKQQNRDETNNSGAASIVLPSTVDIISVDLAITTTATTTTATSSGGNTATASTSTSNLSARGEGKPRSKGHHKVLTANPTPQGENFKELDRNTGSYASKTNSSESARALSLRMGDVNRKIDETSPRGRARDRIKEPRIKSLEDKPRKEKKIYRNEETSMNEFDGLSDTDGDRRKLIKKPSDRRPITARQTYALDRRLSSDSLKPCCICHQVRQGEKLTMSQYEELVARAGQGASRVCLIESTSEFTDQQTQPSHKTKPSKSSPRKPETGSTPIKLKRPKPPKGYPDFSCEVCDCDPCGTGNNKSQSGPSSPRSDEDGTWSRPRSQANSGRFKR